MNPVSLSEMNYPLDANADRCAIRDTIITKGGGCCVIGVYSIRLAPALSEFK